MSLPLVGCHSAAKESEPQGARSASAPSSEDAVAAAEAHHVLRVPAKNGPPKGLVVLLHGFGASASSFQRIAVALSPSFPELDFVTPDAFHPSDLGDHGYQWFSFRGFKDEARGEHVRQAGEEVSLWIDHELDARHLGRDRVALVGFSQGSMVAAWLAIHRSPAPVGVVMFSGRVYDDSAPSDHPPGTRVFVAHGTADERIPVETVEPSVSSLERLGATVQKRIYPGLGHSIDDREILDATAFLKGVWSQGR